MGDHGGAYAEAVLRGETARGDMERVVGEEFDGAARSGFEAESAAGFGEVAALDVEISR
jgi:hypothetical protein